MVCVHEPKGEESMECFKAAVNLKLGAIICNLNKYRRGNPLQVLCSTSETEDSLWLHFFCGELSQSLCFPKPYDDEYKNYVIGRRVKRAVGTWNHDDKEYSYWNLMAWLLTGRIETAFAGVGKRSQLERLVMSFDSKQAPMSFRSLQDIVNGLVNKLPLTGTPMETWAMCNRVVFLDPEFDALPPQAALEYQRELNKKHFPWTSIGLSDSGMCNNNLLKQDLRRFTPFGLSHHNPMRNLYQTLGMKGTETPTIQSRSMAELTQKTGVARRGWNLMTCFLDVPANFEDQLILDNRHLDKVTAESRRFLCFGEVKVAAGDQIEEGYVLSVEPNGKPLSFWVRADHALVTAVETDTVAFNGKERHATWVYIETKHSFKEGVKLTNCHGNKGVVTFADCGTMVDEGTGEERPIDIIVSAKTVGKRRNFGQVLEALLTLTTHGRETVIEDDAKVSLPQLQTSLVASGYAADGTSPVRTPWFTGRTLCGWGFWGLIKNPENQLWTKAEVTATDNRGRRTAGVKLSHIEIRGLTTIFGKDNPITDEILSYQQGFDDVVELVDILGTLQGESFKKSILDWSCIKPLYQNGSYFHSRAELRYTIVDSTLGPEGFMLQLPRLYHVFVPDDENKDVEYRLISEGNNLEEASLPGGVNTFIDKLYIPRAELRDCWQHPTGTWGLSDTGGYLNNIVVACHRYVDEGAPEDNLLRTINRYFHHVSKKLSTKRGDIATYALAVRYPHSAKATATLAKDDLPENWIEIHAEMAENLAVKTGDIVIAERFPCLGFQSLRMQRVRVTDDPACRFVIRVSGNSLVSQGLDFDGDVIFLMSFHTEAAKELLQKEYLAPDASRIGYIRAANATKVPCTKPVNITDIGLSSFNPLNAEEQAEIVVNLTGVKRGTGTVVALAYNTMRIIEGNVGFDDRETNLAMEVIMDKVANSVFAKKHAGVSLEDRCKAAICTANLKELLAMGFPAEGSERLCEIIRKEAEGVGVNDLQRHYSSHLKRGRSSIVNVIVKKKRRFYFATRSNLSPVRLRQHLDTASVDLTSYLWHRALNKRRESNAVSIL